MSSSDKFCGVVSFAKRLFLNLLVFALANVMYPDTFEVVGYMYNVNLHVSFLNIAISVLFILLLTIASDFKSIVYRHGFDVCILGVFLPISVIACQIGSSILYMVYPFVSVLIMCLTARLFEGTAFIRSLNDDAFKGIPFPLMRKSILILYVIFLGVLFLSSPSGFSLNILDIYLRTYEIRAETQSAGVLGYLLGWFVMVFFPILLCKSYGISRVITVLLALFGAVFVFQAFAVKVVFLNFFLVAAFAFFYGRKNFFREYSPQVFFVLVFLTSQLIGVLAFPLLDRFFYLVGLNSIFYMDFFSQNALRYFEGTKLDFGLSKTGIDVGYLIDNFYYQGLGTNQSAGFLPTIFSDLGVVGILVASVLMGIVMSLVKSIYSSSESFAYLVMVALAFSLMNSSFNMLFLSNGLAFIVLIALVLKRTRSPKPIFQGL